VVLAFDVIVFRWAVQVSSKLDASRMLVTEKVSTVGQDSPQEFHGRRPGLVRGFHPAWGGGGR
jgi:hypothetical protein